MSEPIKFPFQVSHNKSFNFIVPIIFFTSIPLAAVLFYACSLTAAMSPTLRMGVVANYFIMNLVSCWVLIKVGKSRTISITEKEVTISPVPIFGHTFGEAIIRPITDFESVELLVVKGKGIRYWICLREKPAMGAIIKKKDDVSFDPPAEIDRNLFVEQLGTALNLKVINNA